MTPRQADREVQEYRAKIRQRRKQQQQQQQYQGQSLQESPTPEIATDTPTAGVLGERAQKAPTSWPGSKGSGGGGGGDGSVSELSEPSTGTRGNLEVGGGQSR